jgi:HSP20 family protein
MLVRRLPFNPFWAGRKPSPWAGFEELDDLRREMNRMFEGRNEPAEFGPSGVFPAINVSETADEIVVRAEVPGIKPGEIDVRVENQTLTISGERRPPTEMENASLHRREREWGRFRRSLSLPTRVEASQVRARSANGVLTIELPKAAEARPKQITVQAG